MIHDENKELTDDELIIHKDFLKLSKYALLHMKRTSREIEFLYALHKNGHITSYEIP